MLKFRGLSKKTPFFQYRFGLKSISLNTKDSTNSIPPSQPNQLETVIKYSPGIVAASLVMVGGFELADYLGQSLMHFQGNILIVP